MLHHEHSKPVDRFRLSITIIGWGLFVTMLGQPSWIGSLPIKFLLKDQLHFQPHELAQFFTLASAAWYLKPLIAIFTDSVPVKGSTSRIYLLVGTGGAAIIWLFLAIAPKTTGVLLITLVVLNLAIVIASTVLGGVIVEVGQQYGATGRISSLRSILRDCAVMLAGPLTGYLSLHFIGTTATIGAALFASLFLFAYFLPERLSTLPAKEAWKNAKLRIRVLFQSKALWGAALMLFLVQLAPGFNTPLFFYQTNILKFDGPFLGMLSFAAGLAGLFAGVFYACICRRWPLRILLCATIVGHSVSSLAYLGYHSKQSAVIIECIAGFATVLAQIPLFDLAARAAPTQCKALAYALMMSFWNFGTDVSDVLGSWLFELYHLNLPDLVWLNSAATLLTLCVLHRLPRVLLENADR